MTILSQRTPLQAQSNRRTLVQRLFGFAQLAKQRHDLGALSDEQLNDIGYSRAQANAEANRAPWDAPSHWKR